MPPHAERLRTPVDRRPRRATTAPAPRRPDARRPALEARGGRALDERSIPERRPPPQADHGLTLLIIFTSSALLVVVLVVLAGAVGQMWILAPIMVIDFAVTAGVLVTVAKLLEDSNSSRTAPCPERGEPLARK
jgi:hypothetical protein